MVIINYLKNIRTQKIILWCYLIWYITVISIYFTPSLKLWSSAIGISSIIGFALVLSTNQQGAKQDTWSKIRLFVFPFCVSSYSATIKDYDFILLFPSNTHHLLIASLACLLFLTIVFCVKMYFSTSYKKSKKPTTRNP
ncbi:hypothetical protein [Wenyingzhuangia sp. IMCC45467]